jgi:hypothetical protein
MTAAVAESPEKRRLSPARRFVVYIALFTFALQSYVTQTHIHDASQGFGGIAKIAATQSPAPGKAPFHHNKADCPLCQAVVHAGFFVSPATPLLHLPFTLVETVAPVFTLAVASNATAHDWQSRAPPRL